MTVSSTTLRNSFNGNGSTTAFSYTFKIFASTEMKVFIRNTTTEVETLRTQGTGSTNYGISGVGSTSGGTVTFVTAPASGESVILLRDTSNLQETDYLPADPFPAESHESALDSLTHQVQEIQDELDRSLKTSKTLTDLTSPEITQKASARASKILGFSSDGASLALVTSLALPTSLTGAGSKMLRVNSGATDYEFQTAAQVFTNLLATEGNGLIAHAGSGAAEPRTITGTSNQITLTNGNGVSGNPTVSIPDAITFTGKTVTAGTFSAMTSSSTLAAMGSANLSIASKQYVDQALAGIRTRLTVRAATTANITISSALNNGDTLDGVTLADGNLVLVKNQSTATQNGIYVVSSSPARSTEADSFEEIIGQLITIQEGTANADDIYLCTANTGGSVGSTAITYVKVSPGSGGTVTSVSTAGLATGGAITGSGTVTVAINSQSALSASPAAADQFAVYDASATAHKKITTTELFGSDQLTALAREYTKTQNFNMTTLTDGTNIAWDLSANQVATVTLGGSRVLSAPSNQVAGSTYILIIVQDGTGSRTLDTSNAAYLWPGGTEPTLSTGAAAIDVFSFVSNGAKMLGVSQLAFS